MKPLQSITTISMVSFVGTTLLSGVSNLKPASAQAPMLISQATDITELCRSITDIPTRFDCLFEQSNRLNQAKNFARQRGERENGGILQFEAEPSMHGPSAESPFTLEDTDTSASYTFTFRLRTPASGTYTRETQVTTVFNKQTNQWDITTNYNREIAPTSCSYAESLEGCS